MASKKRSSRRSSRRGSRGSRKGVSRRPRRADVRNPWAPKPAVAKRMTPDQKKALAAYRFAVQEEDRYLGSVFVTPSGQRRHEALVREAYERCKRMGLGMEHGL